MKIKCEQCNAMVINGVACHEHGCPLSHIDLTTGKPYPRECEMCGCDFEPDEDDQWLCSEECAADYYGRDPDPDLIEDDQTVESN